MELKKIEQVIVMDLVNSVSIGNISPEILQSFVDLKLSLLKSLNAKEST